MINEEYKKISAVYIAEKLNSMELSINFDYSIVIDDCNIDIGNRGAQLTNSERIIKFSNCKFESWFNLNLVDGVTKLIFTNCSFANYLVITGGLRELTISGKCEFHNNLSLDLSHGINVLSDIKCWNSFTISNHSSAVLSLSDIQFVNNEGQLEILACNCNELHIKECHLNMLNIIFNSAGKTGKVKKLKISNSALKRLETTKSDINEYFIENSVVDNITGDYKSPDNINLNISNSTISELHLNLTTHKNIQINGLESSNFTMFGEMPSESELVIQRCTVNRLMFNSVINKGTMRLASVLIPKKGTLGIKHSELNGMNFDQCNFSDCILEFANSKITQIFTSETDFPRKVRSGRKLDAGQAQLVFGQLSHAFDDQGDSVRKVEYHAREIGAHMRYIKWLKSPAAKFSLGLNLISNNFGRSWILGVIFTFGIGFLFFESIILLSPEYNFGFSFVEAGRLLPSFVRFMNPIRIVDLESIFIVKNEKLLTINNGVYLLDFLGRILLAYGYYQTIQAFRKLGKS